MTYLAMDIGASSGKLVKARLEDGRIVTQVVHRFENTQRIITTSPSTPGRWTTCCSTPRTDC